MKNYSFLMKFIIIGDSSVGKSCIMQQFLDQTFRTESDPTIGVQFGTRTIKSGSRTIKLQVWDTAGQEAYKSITRSYYRSTIGVVLVYDITSAKSFKNILKWVDETKNYADSEKLSIILVGNKADLTYERQVTFDQGFSLAQQHAMMFIECSALTGQNVQTVFERLTEAVLQKVDRKEIDAFEESGGIKIGELEIKQRQSGQSRKYCC